MPSFTHLATLAAKPVAHAEMYRGTNASNADPQPIHIVYISNKLVVAGTSEMQMLFHYSNIELV